MIEAVLLAMFPKAWSFRTFSGSNQLIFFHLFILNYEVSITQEDIFVLFFCMSLMQAQGQRLSVGLIGGVSNYEYHFDWVTPVDIISQTVPKWKTAHFGVTGKFKLYEGLSIRSDLYYMSTETDFVAEFKILNEKWRTDAAFSQNTIHLMFAPQLNFGPGRIGYVYGGFMYEINGGSDFSRGNYYSVDNPNVIDFSSEPVVNTVNPAVVLGLGINPRFGRYGFLLDARYTKSRAESVQQKVPRMGRENIAYTAGFTYDLIED